MSCFAAHENCRSTTSHFSFGKPFNRLPSSKAKPLMHDFFLGSEFQPLNVVELLRWRAIHQPDLEVYTFLADENLDSTGRDTEGVSWTYREVDRKARAIGGWLQSIRATGERALLLYPPGLDYIASVFGCLYAGNTVVPVYPPQSFQTLQHLRAIAKDAEASLI